MECDYPIFLKYLVFRSKKVEFWNTNFLTPWNRSTRYFENLEFWLNSRYREDNHDSWLFLFVLNAWTVTQKRRSPGLKKKNSNANYDIVINNHVMIILIILQIPSFYNIFICPIVQLAAIIRILLVGMDI